MHRIKMADPAGTKTVARERKYTEKTRHPQDEDEDEDPKTRRQSHGQGREHRFVPSQPVKCL